MRRMMYWEVQEVMVLYHSGGRHNMIFVDSDADVDNNGVGVTETDISDHHIGLNATTLEKTPPHI